MYRSYTIYNENHDEWLCKISVMTKGDYSYTCSITWRDDKDCPCVTTHTVTGKDCVEQRNAISSAIYTVLNECNPLMHYTLNKQQLYLLLHDIATSSWDVDVLHMRLTESIHQKHRPRGIGYIVCTMRQSK